MTTPVTNTRVNATPARPVTRAAAATTAVAAPRAAGDSIALSATAKATGSDKVVVIDGKEYEVREKNVKKKWPLWEKITTFGVTGLGTVVGGMATIAMAAPMSPTGAMNPTIWAFIGIGLAISAASSYGVGRLASKIGHGIGNLFN